MTGTFRCVMRETAQPADSSQEMVPLGVPPLDPRPLPNTCFGNQLMQGLADTVHHSTREYP